MSISVREILRLDFQPFSEIIRQFYEYAGEAVSESDIKALFQSAVDPDVNLLFFGAFQVDDSGQKTIAGIISVTVGQSSYKVAPFAYIDDFFVRLTERGEGIGSELLEHVAEVARNKGCSNLLLGDGDSETESQRFYRNVGFQDMRCKLLTRPF